MPFTEDICVVVVCDGCGDGWATGPATGSVGGSEGFTPHFPGYDEARQYLIDAGWTLTPGTATDRSRGASRLVCPDCTRLEACADRGHAWGPWIARDLHFPRRGDGTSGGWSGRVRECGRCPDTQWDPPLAPRSPVRRRPTLTPVPDVPAIETAIETAVGGGRS